MSVAYIPFKLLAVALQVFKPNIPSNNTQFSRSQLDHNETQLLTYVFLRFVVSTPTIGCVSQSRPHTDFSLSAPSMGTIYTLINNFDVKYSPRPKGNGPCHEGHGMAKLRQYEPLVKVTIQQLR